MKKMSNDLERKWSNFLTSLENNHCEEKNYFEAIKYVSDIDSKTIDDEEIREKINGYIEMMVALEDEIIITILQISRLKQRCIMLDI